MKYLLIGILLFSNFSLADVLRDCGIYTLRGVVRFGDDGAVIIVNEKTKSEYVIAAISDKQHEQLKLNPYLNQPVTVKVLISNKFSGNKVEAESILKIDFRLPNPINPEDTGFHLEEKKQCGP